MPFDLAVLSVAALVVQGPGRRGFAAVAGLFLIAHADGVAHALIRPGESDWVLRDAAGFAVSMAIPSVLGAGVWWAAREPQTDAARGVRDLRLLVAVNVLNVIDAALTWMVVARGTGEELNPVVNAIGLPGKVALVALGTVLLWRLKPSSLRWAALPLATVVAHHLMGVVFVGV